MKISADCDCSFIEDDLHDSTVVCRDNNGNAIYKAVIEYSSDDGSETALVIAKRIIRQTPFSLTLSDGEDIIVTSATYTEGVASTSGLSTSGLGAVMFVVGVAVALLIILSIVLLIIV